MSENGQPATLRVPIILTMEAGHPPLDDLSAYRVISARDARYDGHLFVGVTSTGVYCRPVCRVRTPLFKNCRFFATPAQAEAATFRPCLKCRPEIAPGAAWPWSVADASRTLARQAAQLLHAQAADGSERSGLGPGAIAARLGVSDRHMRRIFQQEHGVTPLQYLQTRRLLLAKQLLTDTALPVAEVAAASGFRSLRRFNAAFVDGYRMSPSRLRGHASERAGGDASNVLLPAQAAITVKLAYRPPLDVESLLRFLARRAVPEVEVVTGNRVRRSLRAASVAPVAGWVEAEFCPGTPQVRLHFAPQLAPFSARLIGVARRWLDLDADPLAIDAALADLPGAPGLRLPGSPDSFELAVRAVLGQQVTVIAARTLARRLVERFGETVATPWPEVGRAFPSPEVLAASDLAGIAGLGIIRARAAAIQALACRWPELEAALARPEHPQVLIDRLRAIAGIGPWTAHYIAMRALGWPDAFPPNDVALLKAMHTLFDLRSQRAADEHAERWRPWRAYAVLRLWNSSSDLRAGPLP